jgi:hypothetical protein
MTRSGIPVAARRVGKAAGLVGPGAGGPSTATGRSGRDGGSMARGQRTELEVMAVKLNKKAYGYATELIGDGRVVLDERDAWSEHQPSADRENEFIRLHGFDEYGKWYLGVDEGEGEQTKGRYKFPYGDFEKVHRCGVLAAESRAGQYKYQDIENAAAHLHGMIEALKLNVDVKK